MTSTLNMTIVNAAADAAISESALGKKEKLAAAALAPLSATVKAERAAGGDGMASRREAFVMVAIGYFIGYRQAAGDKTFKKGASAGALAIVAGLASLMAEGPKGDGMKARKAEARAKFNEAQLETWKAVAAPVGRVLKLADIEHPNPRAPRAGGVTETGAAETETETETGAAETVAAAVAFSNANVAPIKPETAEETVAVMLEIATFEQRQFGKAQQADAIKGDLGDALMLFHEAITKAARELRETADKVERGAAIAAAARKAAEAEAAEKLASAKAKAAKAK